MQYAIVRQLTCMDPRYMAKNPDSAISKCSGLLQQLISKTLESPNPKMDLLVKSNAMRSKSRVKRKEIENEEKNIDGLQKKLTLM